MSFWDDYFGSGGQSMVNPLAPGLNLQWLAGKSGLIPNQLTPGAPGTTVDTGQSDLSRQRMQDFLAQLQQQSQTGGGAWEDALRQATQATQNTASSLAQREGPMSGLNRRTEMANGAAAARQRGVGEGNILRAETQQQAGDELTNLYGQQMGLDMGQAQAQSNAAAATREANAALTQQAKQNAQGMLQGAGSAVMAAMSKGGPVPGKPVVGGDDPRNDTQPAMLSPGEIVIPRHIANAPDAAERAAAFVAAVKAGHNPKHLAGGGGIDTPDPNLNAGDVAGLALAPHLGLQNAYSKMGGGPQDPSIENGGLLNTAQVDASRAGLLGSLTPLQQRAAGQGPTVSGQMIGNAQDEAMGEGGGMAQVLAHEQARGGAAAGVRAKEQTGAQQALAHAVLSQRTREQAFAQAAQQAAMRNTMLNAGLTLQNQADVRGLLSGAGQAATSFTGMGGESAPNADSLAQPGLVGDFSSPDEWQNPYASGRGGPSDLSGGENFAKGGMVRKTVLSTSQGAASKPEYHDPEEHNPTHSYMQKVAHSEYDAQFKPAKALRRSEENEAPELEPQRYADGGEVSDGEMMRGRTPVPVDESGNPLRKYLVDPALNIASAVQGLDAVPHVVDATRTLSKAAMGTLAPEAMLSASQKQEDQRKALGIRPADERPEEKPSRAMGAAQPKAAVSGGGASPDLYGQGVKMESSAADLAAKARADEATAQAEALAAQQRVLERQQAEREETEAQGHAAAKDALSKVQQAQNEIANVDTTVDPGRFWATRTTGQKILGAIGLALGALGAGPNGINRSAQLIQDSINRDVEAQKAQHTLRLQKGQQRLEGAKSIYGIAHGILQDDIAANDAARAIGTQLAINKLDQIAAKAVSPQAIAQAQALKGQLLERQANYQSEASLRAAQAAHLRASAGDGKVTPQGMAQGTLAAIDELEAAVKSNAPDVSQKRASVLLHLNKQQGGRFNEEINKMNQALVPGSEGFSVAARLGEKVAPGLMDNKFNTLRRHVLETSAMPPNPAYAGD